MPASNRKGNSYEEIPSVVRETVLVTFQPTKLGFSFRKNIVSRVDSDSQAQKAGICVGWVILEIDGNKQPRNASSIHNCLAQLKKNQNEEFKILFAKATRATLDTILEENKKERAERRSTTELTIQSFQKDGFAPDLLRGSLNSDSIDPPSAFTSFSDPLRFLSTNSNDSKYSRLKS